MTIYQEEMQRRAEKRDCYVAPCTHTYSPWDWYEDTANPDNNIFVRSCTLCQAEERNSMPEEVLQIMTATPEDALATKAALEQAVIDDTLTQAAADMLIAITTKHMFSSLNLHQPPQGFEKKKAVS